MTGIGKAEIVRTVLHIGAGHGDALVGYRDKRFHTITLVEPNVEMIPDLHRKAAALPNVTIIAAAAAKQGGEAHLNVYNFPELSSLRSPTGALELFPGLRTTAKPTVELLPLSAILAHHRTDDADLNLLVIDTPGEEAVLLAEAVSSGAINHFQRVTVYCGQVPLFEGSADAAYVVGLIEPLFFDLHDAAPDPLGRLCLRFRKNERLRARIEEFEARVASADERAAAHAEVAEKLRTRVEELEVTLAEREKDAADHKRRIAAQTGTADQLRLQLKEMKRSLAQAHKQKAEFEFDLNAANAQRNLYEKELSKLEAHMEMIRQTMAPPGEKA